MSQPVEPTKPSKKARGKDKAATSVKAAKGVKATETVKSAAADAVEPGAENYVEREGIAARVKSLGRLREKVPGLKQKANASTKASKTTDSDDDAPFTVHRDGGRVNYEFSGRSGSSAVTTKRSDANRPVPARAFSGRLVALALVLVTITILLAPTVRTFVAQRAEMAELEQGIAAEQAKQKDLNDQLARWNDPAYVSQEARDRLYYVKPGETGYLVIGATKEDEMPPAETSAESDKAPLPWTEALWSSIEGASK